MKLFDQIKAYLIASKEEFTKVSWPTRKDTIRYSSLVIGVSVLVATFFAALDLGFTQLTTVAANARAARVKSAATAPIQGTTPIQVDTTPSTSKTPTLDLKDLQTQPVKVDATTKPAPTTPAPTTK
jgi:preprotein translocase subunit SecE